MKKAVFSPSVGVLVLVILLLQDVSYSDPRIQTVRLMCGNTPEHNPTNFVLSFVATMENISDQVRNSGFGIAITGTAPDADHGLVQCYGDLSYGDCLLCFAQARQLLPQCFPVIQGRIFLDGCFMRSDNYSFFQEYTGPEDQAVCGNTTKRDSAFQDSARRALSRAVSFAPNNGGYARAQVPVSGAFNQSAYVLANCWRNLSPGACRACLENALTSISTCFPWSEGRALNTGCFMRYSDTNFLNPVPGNGSSRGRIIFIVSVSVSAAAVLIIGAVIGIYIWKRRIIAKKRKGSGDAEKMVKILHDSSLNFKYYTLEKATGSFDEANKLGQGGFGTVYKGTLPDGREIAVKRLFFSNKHRAADFYNEVNIISSVEHKNLVRLLGCSCSGPESLLVYEYLPNKSLDCFIFDSSNGKALNWEKRFDIIIGTAEGLVYLHENTKTRIIHRDIKASNILLDSRLRAKIADFGLARTFQEDKSHISTAIAGTLGYMAPEYLARGKLTEKADVYSFGVLLLEIVSGRQNNGSKGEHTDSLVTIAWIYFQQGKVEELFDANLMLHIYNNAIARTEILRVVHVGLLCVQEVPTLRPSMSQALQMLVKKEENLPAPTSPPFVEEGALEASGTTGTSWWSHSPHNPTASVPSISHSLHYPR